MDDTYGQKLYVRGTRGEALTESERTRLDAWYARLDAEESARLITLEPLSPTLESLRAEVAKALTELRCVTERMQAQYEANEALRQEVIKLSERLATEASPKAIQP